MAVCRIERRRLVSEKGIDVEGYNLNSNIYLYVLPAHLISHLYIRVGNTQIDVQNSNLILSLFVGSPCMTAKKISVPNTIYKYPLIALHIWSNKLQNNSANLENKSNEMSMSAHGGIFLAF